MDIWPSWLRNTARGLLWFSMTWNAFVCGLCLSVGATWAVVLTGAITALSASTLVRMREEDLAEWAD